MTGFTQIECASCGIQFCLSENYAVHRKKDGKNFFCPNGHGLNFINTESDKRPKARILDLIKK